MHSQRNPKDLDDYKPSSFCDGRKKKSRIVRKAFHCTGCGAALPEDKSDWGLVWDSQIHGFCRTCLVRIRGDSET